MSDWIDVNDRLPDHDEAVLVYRPRIKQPVQLVLWFFGDENDLQITHWMPLPEAPTQNDSGTKRVNKND